MSTDVTHSESPLAAHVAEEIRALMGRRQINKTQLAQRLKVDDTWVGRRLNGKQDFTLADLQRIAVVLGVDVSDLLPARTRASSPVLVDPLAPRIVATAGEHRQPRRNRPVHPAVPMTRAVATKRVRPITPIAV